MSQEAKWYVLHTYSGYENAVKTSIEKMVENRKMQDYIHQVIIPTETVTEITDNGTKVIERKLFPGYVLIKMVMTDEAWYLARGTRGVSGFVSSGSGSATKPTPLTDDEIAQLGVERREIIVGYEVGDSVNVKSGPLEGFSGKIENIDKETRKITVKVSMFGRETPIEVEHSQIEKLVD